MHVDACATQSQPIAACSSMLIAIHPPCCKPFKPCTRLLHHGEARALSARQALFGELSADVIVLTILYSLAGLGIAIVNDFKSIEGDRCVSITYPAAAYVHVLTSDYSVMRHKIVL